jgi:hypothetical protein
MRAWASETVGRAGMAPFLVVQMAPHALESLSASRSLSSLWKMEASLATLTRTEPTKASPAPVVSMVLTLYPGTLPLKSWKID